MSGNSVPAYYANVSTFSKRSGIYYVGDTPVITWNKTLTANYEVRNYYGNIITTGTMAATSTLTLTPPAGGWKPGWYRVYLTQETFDSVVGYATGATCFIVLTADSRFPDSVAYGSIFSNGGNESRDLVTKAILGMGTSRLIIGSVSNPTSGVDTLVACSQDAINSQEYWNVSSGPFYDSARPRNTWAAFPNGGTYDLITVAGSVSGTYLRVYPKTGTLAATGNVYISSAPGSSSGSKIVVYYPNNTTVVETFDNLGTSTAAQTTINASSNYIKAFAGGQNASATTAATAIPNTAFNSLASIVSTLYSAGCSYFEGPYNEPTLTEEVAQQTILFAAAVHAGNINAKAMGPTPVDINNVATGSSWDNFLAAGGASELDVISFHDYNSMTSGNLAGGRQVISRFKTALSNYGLSSKPLWQTEAGAAFTGVYGVYHPRRARVKILHTLLWEQYGIPRERNTYWYDRSHGFWTFPTWIINSDGSINPDGPLHYNLARETFGMTHAVQHSFGTIGDKYILGSTYSGSAGSCTVLISSSHIDNYTVTLTVTGTTSPLTVVDAWGNTSTVNVISGRVTVPIDDVPTYIRLPLGVSVTPYSIYNHPPISLQGQSSSSSLALPSATVGANINVINNNDKTLGAYGSSSDWYFGSATLPESIILSWKYPTRADRVIIFNGMSWQNNSSFYDFDILTSNDGVTWTLQRTVTKATPSSFLFGTSSVGTWCTRETYWDEQWIFDISFDATVSIKYLKITVRGISAGGEPDAAAVAAGGQGNATSPICVQEIFTLCDGNALPQYVRQ